MQTPDELLIWEKLNCGPKLAKNRTRVLTDPSNVMRADIHVIK